MDIELVSFNLCPFVQRSVITLEEKAVEYEVTYVDLYDKPDWFLAISPLGKVPLLRVGDVTLFESAVINEYLDESTPGRLHPQQALERAKHRMWTEFASTLGASSYQLMTSQSEQAAREAAEKIRAQFSRMEPEIAGPYWSGEHFALVDAAFAPMLQRVRWCGEIAPELGCFKDAPKTAAYTEALSRRPSVVRSLPEDIHDVFLDYLAGRGSATRDVNPAWLHHRRS